MKICEIDPCKICDECGDCEFCELDPNKRCDDCCKCIEDDVDYKGIAIEKIILDGDGAKGILH